MEQVGAKHSFVRFPECISAHLYTRFHRYARKTPLHCFCSKIIYCSCHLSQHLIKSVWDSFCLVGSFQNSFSCGLNETFFGFFPQLKLVIHTKQPPKMQLQMVGIFFVVEKLPPGCTRPIDSMRAFGIRKNMPALPALPHKRIKREEIPHHSTPQSVTIGATRGRKRVVGVIINIHAFFTPHSQQHT